MRHIELTTVRLTLFVVLFTFLFINACSAPAISEHRAIPDPADKTRFVVIGDMPYADSEYAMLTAPDGEIAAAIRTVSPPVLIHLGDFKKVNSDCTDALIKDRYVQIFNLNPFRTVYTPGDNDWTDCDRKSMTIRFNELERLAFLRNLFFNAKTDHLTRDIPGLIRQNGFIENAIWKIDDVIFATLHLPGTNNGRKEILLSDINKALDEADYRDESNSAWLQKLFESADLTQAVVIAFQADIYRSAKIKPACTKDNRTDCDGYKRIRDDIDEKARHYKKPVLVIHGDPKTYCLNQPVQKISNLWRLNAAGDFKYVDASQVIFNPGNTETPFEVSGLLDKQAPPAVCDYSH